MSERIAGVLVDALQDDAAEVLSLARLECAYQFASMHSTDPLADPRADSQEAGISKVSLPSGSDRFVFALDRSLLDYLQLNLSDRRAPNQAEFIRLALEQPGKDKMSTAVESDFRPDALNAINASYYASEVAFSAEAGLASWYAGSKTVNQALGALMAGHGQAGHLRVKELCSGSRTEHWNYIAEGAAGKGVHSMDVTLTDFVRPPISPELNAEGLGCRAEVYSLFDSFASLPKGERYNAMLTTYGFDSVWLPEDIFLTRDDNDRWQQSLFRVKVADWNPRQRELLEAMRQSRALTDAKATDYWGIAVEEARQPFNIDDHPFAEYLAQTTVRRFHFPGGLIRRAVEAFDGQLDDNGIFINGDVGNFGREPERTKYYPHLVSGIAARYHAADFVLARDILQKEYGLNAQLYSSLETVENALGPDWPKLSTWYERKVINQDKQGSGVMVVTRQ